MRWFKHLTRSHEDEKLCKIRDQFGSEGYGVWWIILERIAGEMDGPEPVPSLELSWKNWAKSCGISVKKFQNFVTFLEKNLGIPVEVSGQFCKITVTNLLKYRDEYSKKSGQKNKKTPSKSGECPDQDTDTETEADTETKKKPPYPLSGEGSKSKPKRTPKPKPGPDVNFEKLKSFYETFPRARTNWTDAREAWDAMVKKFGVDVVMLAAKQYCEGNPDPKSRKACERFLRPGNIENWSRPDAIGYRDPTTIPSKSNPVAPQSTFGGEPMARVGSDKKRGSELISVNEGFGKLLGEKEG